jgi:3-oxoacyl-[acyl-carrier-protein] synthase II
MTIAHKKDPKRRVVVTGVGVVSSIGIGVEDFWKNLTAGMSGISFIEAFDTSDYPVHKGGEVKNFRPEDFIDKRKMKRIGRASQLAIAAARLALSDASLKKSQVHKAPVLLGTTMGETQILEELDRSWIQHREKMFEQILVTAYSSNNLSVNVAIDISSVGLNMVMPTACSSANYAIGHGFDMISHGQSDLALCGGVDAFSKVAFIGFNRLFAMASEKCQPFDKNRKGMMLGEGSAILVLEALEHAEKRGARIYAEILGYGLSCDAHHMTQPSEDGIARCIEKALKESGVSKESIDYISAHGTGTPQNDKTEWGAIKKVFGKRSSQIPCSSIKSMLGHTMGAASAMESAACCLAVRDGIIPPTINFETPDPDCDADCVPNKTRKTNLKHVLNNSCAFGGNNSCLVVVSFML